MRWKTAFLALLLLLLLPGCGEQEVWTDQTPTEILEAILSSYSETEQQELSLYLTELFPGLSGFEEYLSQIYQIDPQTVVDACILYPQGVHAEEFVVLFLDSTESGQAAREALSTYLENRKADFYGYAPDAYAMLEKGEVLGQGAYAALMVCDRMQEAAETFSSCFQAGTPPTPKVLPTPQAKNEDGSYSFVPPNLDDMTLFDIGPLLEAYRSGDRSALSRKDQETLEVVDILLEQVIHTDMSDYEKELAIHDYIVDNAGYDMGLYDEGNPDPDSESPYGVLVKGIGTCRSYAVTFQLLMELLGIECQTVVGATYQSTRDHAWNIVQLDGAWYCVDVMWDDPSPDQENDGSTRYADDHHRFFNVTSRWLATAGDHQWDYENVPEATGTQYAWKRDTIRPTPDTP